MVVGGFLLLLFYLVFMLFDLSTYLILILQHFLLYGIVNPVMITVTISLNITNDEISYNFLFSY